MKIMMYPHGGSGNRGCEAIVRGSINILNSKKAYLFSSEIKQDMEVELDQICEIRNEQKPIKKNTMKYIYTAIRYYLFKDKEAFDRLVFDNIFKSADSKTIALSIGGDNYCYGEATYIYLINRELKRKGVKTVLWCCSVDESQLTPNMRKDLATYDKIIARESLTYETMKKINVNTVLYPDPAFILDTHYLDVPDLFLEQNTVGINVSPMIINNEKNKGMTMENYCNLIEFIIENTTMNIALIPHVIWKDNDDRIPIEKLYSKYSHTNRIVKIDALPAEKIKGYIARCRFFIGARTHSTIAAYSSCVPTLVVGYSIKAKGIAKDLFGTYDHYVLPVQSLKKKDDLKNSFQWLMLNEDSIRNQLNTIMPEYKEKVYKLREELKEL